GDSGGCATRAQGAALSPASGAGAGRDGRAAGSGACGRTARTAGEGETTPAHIVKKGEVAHLVELMSVEDFTELSGHNPVRSSRMPLIMLYWLDAIDRTV